MISVKYGTLYLTAHTSRAPTVPRRRLLAQATRPTGDQPNLHAVGVSRLQTQTPRLKLPNDIWLRCELGRRDDALAERLAPVVGPIRESSVASAVSPMSYSRRPSDALSVPNSGLTTAISAAKPFLTGAGAGCIATCAIQPVGTRRVLANR